MNYLVLELQTTNGVTSSLTYQFNELPLAEQKYYLTLASAAISEVDVHSAVLLNEVGETLKFDSYNHIQNN